MATASPLVNKFFQLQRMLKAEGATGKMDAGFGDLERELRTVLWENDPGRGDRPPFFVVLTFADGMLDYEIAPNRERLREIAEQNREDIENMDIDVFILTVRSPAPVVVSETEDIHDYLPEDEELSHVASKAEEAEAYEAYIASLQGEG